VCARPGQYHATQTKEDARHGPPWAAVEATQIPHVGQMNLLPVTLPGPPQQKGRMTATLSREMIRESFLGGFAKGHDCWDLEQAHQTKEDYMGRIAYFVGSGVQDAGFHLRLQNCYPSHPPRVVGEATAKLLNVKCPPVGLIVAALLEAKLGKILRAQGPAVPHQCPRCCCLHATAVPPTVMVVEHSVGRWKDCMGYLAEVVMAPEVPEPAGCGCLGTLLVADMGLAEAVAAHTPVADICRAVVAADMGLHAADGMGLLDAADKGLPAAEGKAAEASGRAADEHPALAVVARFAALVPAAAAAAVLCVTAAAAVGFVYTRPIPLGSPCTRLPIRALRRQGCCSNP
jgi:hypothetical protein